jgi:hypothetical protein
MPVGRWSVASKVFISYRRDDDRRCAIAEARVPAVDVAPEGATFEDCTLNDAPFPGPG